MVAAEPALAIAVDYEETPPLVAGDHLTRYEFERRYDAMPWVKKAELIEGVVYMPSPVNQMLHGGPHSVAVAWIGAYMLGTPGVESGDNSSLRLDMDNEPQPDALLYIDPDIGGQAKLDEDGYLVSAPELVFEVAASSVSYDLHSKLHTYRRHGVREYVVWRVRERAIDWFALRGGRYVPLAPDAEGVYRSEVFPGLWLDAAALLRGDRVTLARRIREGLDSPEHAEFVERLEQARRDREP
jgi:Uma2 family endonuclease